MYGIFTYIGVASGVKVGKYYIHGVLGYWNIVGLVLQDDI